MFERLYLHVGLHKTGTSSIQRCLFKHRESLATELSLCYPSLSPNLSLPLRLLVDENSTEWRRSIVSGLSTSEQIEARNVHTVEMLKEEFQRADTRDAIVSGESLSMLDEAAHRRLRDWLEQFAREIKVICAVRNPLHWAVSSAQMSIRGGATVGEFRTAVRHQHIRKKLETLLPVYGREGIILLDFDHMRRHAHGVTGALLEALGLRSDWAEGRELPPQNVAMSMEAAYLISALNQRFPAIVDGKWGEGRSKGDILPLVNRIRGSKFRVPSEFLERVRKFALPDVEWLQAEFGLKLSMEPPELPQLDDSQYLFDQEAVDSIAEYLLELQNKVSEQEKQLRALGAIEKREVPAKDIDKLQKPLAAAEARITAMEQSTSWRVTRPIRAIERWLTGER